MKKLTLFLSLVIILLFSVNQVSAHVVVKPNEVGVGERVNFSINVPTEKDVPSIQIRLIIPEGLQSVRPNVKQGWDIEIKKTGEGEEVKITEIIWSGGSIPAEMRDEFVFSAQAPADETDLVWKAYQTYEDGEVVAWENNSEAIEEYEKNNPPKEGEHDDNAPKPYSQTKVINDLGKETSEVNNKIGEDNQNLLGVISLVLSIAAIVIASRKK